jgi:hypothetical protein
MDEIEKRLREAADNCIKFYTAWQKDKKVGNDRDNLMEAIHELRKVAARLEIDIAISERTEMASRPLPIPPHRSSSRRQQRGPEDRGNSLNDSQGNSADTFNNQGSDESFDAPAAPRAPREPREQQEGGLSQGGPRRTLGTRRPAGAVRPTQSDNS